MCSAHSATYYLEQCKPCADPPCHAACLPANIPVNDDNTLPTPDVGSGFCVCIVLSMSASAKSCGGEGGRASDLGGALKTRRNSSICARICTHPVDS